ncbi:hypothetical protein GCM10022419_127360 [Nonomuraea rosea]|uniref:Uncharacterized protein n=1 Tax=Nonomuraea rosea TaxID=638574 RepID=A0ABP6ZYF9_9ACTN
MTTIATQNACHADPNAGNQPDPLLGWAAGGLQAVDGVGYDSVQVGAAPVPYGPAAGEFSVVG